MNVEAHATLCRMAREIIVVTKLDLMNKKKQKQEQQQKTSYVNKIDETINRVIEGGGITKYFFFNRLSRLCNLYCIIRVYV